MGFDDSTSISLLPCLAKLPSGSALAALYSQISSAQHKNLTSTPVSAPSALDGLPVLTFNYDEGHSGRFTVFGTDPPGGTVSVDDVLAQPSPSQFIRKHLTCDGVDAAKETVIFHNGLNTPHQTKEGYNGMNAVDRIVQYSNMLGGVRFAQVHTGSSQDQGDVVLNVSNTLALKALIFLLHRIGNVEKARPNERGEVVLSARIVDYIQSALSTLDIEDNDIKKSMRALFAHATPENPFVHVAYSRGSIELASALRIYKKSLLSTGESVADVEARMRASITVVTIGCANNKWVDGPAYLHIASRTDSLAGKVGVHAGKTREAGADAVFLTCESPYNAKAFDNHNFASVTCQYLSVIMKANDTTSFRKLYDLARMTVHSDEKSAEQKGCCCCRLRPRGVCETVRKLVRGRPAQVGGGKLVIPENIYELTKAMIIVTRGKKNLWRENIALNGADEFPNEENAVQLLKKHYDSVKIERIRKIFAIEEQNGSVGSNGIQCNNGLNGELQLKTNA